MNVLLCPCNQSPGSHIYRCLEEKNTLGSWVTFLIIFSVFIRGLGFPDETDIYFHFKPRGDLNIFTYLFAYLLPSHGLSLAVL